MIIPVSVVIASFNGAGRIEALLEALAGQRAPEDEIIVVVDASTDGTGAIAARFGVRVITNPRNRGVGYGRNAGAAAARHEILAFFDDDVVPAGNYLDVVRREMAAPSIACIQGPHSIVPAGDDAGLWGRVDAAVVHHHCTVTMVRGTKCLVLYSGAFCIRRQAFLASGGFVESFQGAGGEELDMGMRLLANCTLTFVPDLQSRHRFKALGHRLRTLRARARHYLRLDRKGRLLPASVAIPEKLRLVLVATAVLGAVGALVDVRLSVLALAALAAFFATDSLLFRNLFRWKIVYLLIPVAVFRLLTYLTIGLGAAEGMTSHVFRREVSF